MKNVMVSLVASEQSFDATILKKLLISAAATAMLTATANAQEVPSATSGDPATAAYINTLVAAINDNKAKIAALTNGEDQSVAGKTYDILINGMSFSAYKLGTDPTLRWFTGGITTSESSDDTTDVFGGFSGLRQEHGYGKIRFNIGGTVTVATADQEIVLLTSSSSDIGTGDSEDDPLVASDYPSLADLESSPASTYTWEQTGSTVTLTLSSTESTTFQVSLNGQSIQAMDPMTLDVENTGCISADGVEDATYNVGFLQARDWTGDGVNDAYCLVEYEGEVITGVLAATP